jgi:hypothetical protein
VDLNVIVPRCVGTGVVPQELLWNLSEKSGISGTLILEMKAGMRVLFAPFLLISLICFILVRHTNIMKKLYSSVQCDWL